MRITSILQVGVVLAGSVAVWFAVPAAHADCQDGAVTPASGGTYSLCSGGQWTHVDRQLCVDYPQSQYCPAASRTPSSTPSSSTSASPSPAATPPAVPLPPTDVNLPNPPNAPGVGCTWVNGYTKKNGTHVNGYWRC